MKLWALAAAIVSAPAAALAQADDARFSLLLESGLLWQSRKYVRITNGIRSKRTGMPWRVA